MLTTAEKVMFLKSAPVFERVAGEDLWPLARLAEVRSFEAGTRVFGQGDLGDALYVVLTGRVAIERRGRRLGELGPGEAFGEMALLDAEPRSADAVAVESSDLLSIGSEEFYEAMHEQVELAEGVIRMLSRRLRQLMGEVAGPGGAGSAG